MPSWIIGNSYYTEDQYLVDMCTTINFWRYGINGSFCHAQLIHFNHIMQMHTE